MKRCDICGEEFEPYGGMRRAGSTLRETYWCKPHQDEFDAIDWEEVYERGR